MPTVVFTRVDMNIKTIWNTAQPLILPISSENLTRWNGVRPENATKKYRTEDLNFCLRIPTEQKAYNGPT